MATIEISYEDEAFEAEADREWVKTQLESILEILDEDGCEIGVSFISDGAMQELNREYRHLDEPTDILSFCNEEDDLPFWSGEGEERYLGDLAISLDTLKRNAQSFSVEIEEELLRLLIHGTLHLLGFDHETNESDEPMLVRQEELLVQLRGIER